MKSSFSNDQELIHEDWCTPSQITRIFNLLIGGLSAIQDEISDLEDLIENDDPKIDQQVLIIRDFVHFYEVRLSQILQHNPESYAHLLKSTDRFVSWTQNQNNPDVS